MIPHVITGTSLTIILDGVPSTVSKNDEIFEELCDLLKNQATNGVTVTQIKLKLDALQNATIEFNKASRSARVTKGVKISINEKTSRVHIIKGKENHEMPAKLSADFIKIARAKKSNKMLRNFLLNIGRNPNPETLDNIFEFLKHNNLFITEDGHFIAYKYVTHDFKDKYTGKLDNRVGKTVKMEREKVTLDRDRSCSSGLHVGAWEYVSGCGNIVLCKINPANVVSVPHDYNGQKMRVCEYKVVDKTKEEIHIDFLKKQKYYKA